MSSSYRIALNEWLAQLDVSADVLIDVGGAQQSLRPRVKSWNVRRYLIADLEQPHEGDTSPDIEIDLNEDYGRWYEIRDINHPLYQSYHRADLVFCLEVFDYVWDTRQAFKNLELFMAPGATAWVTFPSTYPLHQPIEDDALRYMPGGIKKLAASAGLEIVQMIPRRPETNLWQQFYTAERMRAAKHQDHAFTGWIVEFRK